MNNTLKDIGFWAIVIGVAYALTKLIVFLLNIGLTYLLHP